MTDHRNYTVTGMVQGVFFRATTQKQAKDLGLTGYVKNLPNGDVYVEVEGSIEQLEAFEEFLKIGPKYAQVDSLQKEEGSIVGFTSFEIRHH